MRKEQRTQGNPEGKYPFKVNTKELKLICCCMSSRKIQRRIQNPVKTSKIESCAAIVKSING